MSANVLPPTVSQAGPVTQLLARLVAIPSVNPAYIKGAPEPNLAALLGVPAGAEALAGETRMAVEVQRQLEGLGAEVHWDEVVPGRPAVYGIVRGHGGGKDGRKLLGIDVHMDTVAVEGCLEPFSGRVDTSSGRLHGRGSCDTKATLACALDVLRHARATGQRPAHDVLIAGTVDEEAGPLGALQLLNWLEARGLVVDELLVAEPTQCVPVRGHKGVLRFKFSVGGTAAHSATPTDGKNALIAAAAVVASLKEENVRLASGGHGELGPPSLTPTMLEAG